MVTEFAQGAPWKQSSTVIKVATPNEAQDSFKEGHDWARNVLKDAGKAISALRDSDRFALNDSWRAKFQTWIQSRPRSTGSPIFLLFLDILLLVVLVVECPFEVFPRKGSGSQWPSPRTQMIGGSFELEVQLWLLSLPAFPRSLGTVDSGRTYFPWLYYFEKRAL